MEKEKNKTTQLAIEDLKRACGLKTDYALAKKLNMPQSSISRYSNGKTSISLEKLEEIAESLGKKITIKIKKK
jgi:transcriptional regulator with XRE-family HTH domain